MRQTKQTRKWVILIIVTFAIVLIANVRVILVTTLNGDDGSSSSDTSASWYEKDPAMATEMCQTRRGQSGMWLQDWQHAVLAQYATPLKRFRNFPSFQPSSEQPYRKSTSYKWVDETCPVHLVTVERLCHAMQSLELDRIHIVGDSLNLQFAQALWKLLGHKDDPITTVTKEQWLRFQWSRTIDCPNSSFKFNIAFTRNDLIDGQEEEYKFEEINNNNFNCGYAEYCLPWIPKYTNHDGRTLLIINGGTHIHSQEAFVDIFNKFVQLIDQRQANSGDVVMFRTTVPGHDGCQDPNVQPLSINVEDFQKDLVADDRSWDKFAGYNQYARDTIVRRNQQSNGNNIHLLDVAPMTVQRKDGHVSGPERCDKCKENDCLHYILPGPPDWWVHLMFSNLVNMSAARKIAH